MISSLNPFRTRTGLGVAVLLGVGISGGIALGFGRKAAVAPSVASPDDVRVAAPAVSGGRELIQAFPESDGATERLQAWCTELKRELAPFKWKLDPCTGIDWKIGGSSVKGRPLVYAEFGDPSSNNTTVVFSAVHGDEITPLYLGLKLVLWLKENEQRLGKTHVVVAPFVNPDGFFRRPRTRTNARGVDLNRNLATRDWHIRAIAVWKRRFRSDPRRNPGREPHSEPETVFQEELLRKVRPQKVVSVHAPLNFLDYDGPSQLSLDRFPQEYVKECLRLRTRLKAISGGFFPGSLGNFAGQEMGIPTLTLELPSADPAKAAHYWKVFSKGIHVMIDFVVPGFRVGSLLPAAAEDRPSDTRQSESNC